MRCCGLPTLRCRLADLPTRSALISGPSAVTQADRAGHSAPDAQGAGLRSRAATLGAGRAPLRGGSAAAPAAARAAAAVAGAADGPREATPMHGGRRVCFCENRSMHLVCLWRCAPPPASIRDRPLISELSAATPAAEAGQSTPGSHGAGWQSRAASGVDGVRTAAGSNSSSHSGGHGGRRRC